MPESDHQAMTIRQRVRKHWPWIAVVVVAAFLVAESQDTAEEAQHAALQAKRAARKAKGFAAALQAGLIESCENNGNTLRKVVQKRIHKEINQSNTPLLERLFPQISPEELGRLVARQNAERHQELTEIKPVDCAAQYR